MFIKDDSPQHLWKTLKGENTFKKARGTKVKVFFQGLHMTCVVFMLVYSFKICISNTLLTLNFTYKYILTTN
jgi:hypothetical protein